VVAHPRPQRLALEQLGDRVGDVAFAGEVVNREDVRVRQRRDRVRLFLESRQRRWILRERASGRTLIATSRFNFASRAL
jgi:hypothetical protein